MQRVYGGFLAGGGDRHSARPFDRSHQACAHLLDPTISLLRPIPVTAWLPLSMIFFGLGPNAAIFLVFLGAFYPILLNTVFGVRSVDPRLFEAAAMLGCSGPADVSPGRASGGAARRPQWPAGCERVCLDPDRGRRDDRRPTGLGSVIMDGRKLSRTDLVITGMIVIGACGFLTDRSSCCRAIGCWPWSPQHHA